MKYFIILILVVVYLFPKPFITYPGYMTQESYNEWEATKKHCYGFVYVTKEDAGGDWADKDWCFGIPL